MLVGVILLYVSLQLYSLLLTSAVGQAASIWTARTLQGALLVLGKQPVLSGADVILGTTTFRVIPECTIAAPLVLFAASVIIIPTNPVKKLAAIGFGAIALSLVNVLRLLTLLAAVDWDSNLFETLHVLVWQPLMVLLTLLMWTVWTMWELRHA